MGFRVGLATDLSWVIQSSVTDKVSSFSLCTFLDNFSLSSLQPPPPRVLAALQRARISRPVVLKVEGT